MGEDSWYNSASCFANTRAGGYAYTYGYCSGNIIIQIIAIILMIQTALLLVWHMNQKGW